MTCGAVSCLAERVRQIDLRAFEKMHGATLDRTTTIDASGPFYLLKAKKMTRNANSISAASSEFSWRAVWAI